MPDEDPWPAEADPPPTLAWGGRAILPGLAVGHAAFHWIVQSSVVLLPDIQQTFLLGGVGVGGVLAAREVATGLVKLPAGVFVDVLRSYWRTLLVTCLAASAAGAVLIGASWAYPAVLLGVMIVALGHSIWHLPASAALSHHRKSRRGMALAFHGLGGSLGDVLGPLVTGALLVVLTWRQLLLWYALIPLVAAGLGMWAFRNIGWVEDAAPKAGSPRTRITGELLGKKVLWGLALVYALRAMALVALLATLPLYLDNEISMSPASRGLHIGLLIAMGLVAKPAAGYLSDRLGRKRVLVAGLLWSSLVAFSLVVVDTGVAFTLAVGLLGLFLYPDQPVLTAAVFDLVGTQVAASALGIVTFGAVVLATVSPLVAGALYEGVGFHAATFYVAALLAAAALLIAVLPLSPAEAGCSD